MHQLPKSVSSTGLDYADAVVLVQTPTAQPPLQTVGDFRALEQIEAFCHRFSMSTAQLLEEFEKLPLDAQREFSDAILHRTAHFDYDAPSDEELSAAARAVFATLDREEEGDAAPR